MKFRKMKLAACLLSVATAVSAVPTYAVEDLFVSGPDEVAVEEAYYPEETGDVLTEAVGMAEGDLFSDAEVYVPDHHNLHVCIESHNVSCQGFRRKTPVLDLRIHTSHDQEALKAHLPEKHLLL